MGGGGLILYFKKKIDSIYDYLFENTPWYAHLKKKIYI
jgi:hypothetical protein